MKLSECYKLIKGSMVGFSPGYYPTKKPPVASDFAEIFGTGFVVREDGIIATNEHVARHILDEIVPGSPVPGLSPCMTMIGKFMGTHWVYANLQVENCILLEDVKLPTNYYGPEKPDVAFVQVKARGLPAVELDDSPLEEGLELATA